MFITTFEEYLQDIHAQQYFGLDDDMPDAYADWRSNLDPDEVVEMAEKWGSKLSSQNVKIAVDTLNKI